MYIGFVSGGLRVYPGPTKAFCRHCGLCRQGLHLLQGRFVGASGSANETDVGVCLPKGSKHQ